MVRRRDDPLSNGTGDKSEAKDASGSPNVEFFSPVVPTAESRPTLQSPSASQPTEPIYHADSPAAEMETRGNAIDAFHNAVEEHGYDGFEEVVSEDDDRPIQTSFGHGSEVAPEELLSEKRALYETIALRRRLAESEHMGHAGSESMRRTESMASFTNLANTSFAGGSFSSYPQEVIKIARQMRGLNEEEFLMLADLTQKRAWRNVYSLLEFRGTSWYLPALRPVEDDEPSCGIGYERAAGVWIAAMGMRVELNIVGYLVRIALLILLWVSLYFAMPEHLVWIHGFVFDPILLVLISAIVGGIISRLLRVPSLACVLWVAIAWANIPHFNYLTSGINVYVRKAAFTFGLNVILIRAGLYIKPEELKPMLLQFLAFAYLPAAFELISHSFVAKALFDYPDYNWAFMQGSVAAAVSPAVVVPAVLALRVDGFSTKGGPSVLMMPGCPAEMVVAIWNIDFMAQLTLDDGKIPLWLNIISGPLQLLGGVVVGLILGALHYGALKMLLWEAKKLPHRNYTLEHMNRVNMMQTVLLVIGGAAVLFFTKHYNLYGGGAIAVVFMAMTTGALQRRQSEKPYFAEQFKDLCLGTADLWDLFTMPLLFSMVGSTINLTTVFTAEFFPKMLACMAVGLAARMIVAVVVTIPQDWSPGERAVMACGWIGKASVQAALGRVALDRANDIFDTVAEKDGLAAAQENVVLAQRVANAAVVLIMFCAPIASLLFVRLGPHALRKDA